jgi:serine/threonine protein kinase
MKVNRFLSVFCVVALVVILSDFAPARYMPESKMTPPLPPPRYSHVPTPRCMPPEVYRDYMERCQPPAEFFDGHLLIAILLFGFAFGLYKKFSPPPDDKKK